MLGRHSRRHERIDCRDDKRSSNEEANYQLGARARRRRRLCLGISTRAHEGRALASRVVVVRARAFGSARELSVRQHTCVLRQHTCVLRQHTCQTYAIRQHTCQTYAFGSARELSIRQHTCLTHRTREARTRATVSTPLHTSAHLCIRAPTCLCASISLPDNYKGRCTDNS